MRQTRPRGTPIDNTRRNTWRGRFEGYRYGVTDAHLTEWLSQFDAPDRDTAARILDVVEFISAEQIDAAFRSLLNRLPGWHKVKRRRIGRFAFVAFSRAAGESGNSMVHRFRLANKLNNDRFFSSLFIERSELLRHGFGRNDTVVFLDDFIGSGKQAVDAWQTMFQELTATVGNVFLLSVAAFANGADRIKSETRLELITHRHLTLQDSVREVACARFTAEEKAKLHHYCKIASPAKPWGYGDCGLVVVLSHQCPNNSIAILHESSNQWEPPFPRS
jgi:hypothetical protein